MPFSRLELRELLRCVERTDCEPEVIDKLRAEIGVEVRGRSDIALALPQLKNDRAEAVARAEAAVARATGIQLNSGPMLMTEYEIAAMVALCKERGDTFTADDVAAVNEERRVSWEAQQKMQRGISYTAHSSQRPQNADGHPLDHAEKGERNKYGEMCIGHDPTSHCSIFECKEGHAYVANNPSVVGCTECAMAGNAAPGGGEAVAAGAARVDRGLIPGQEGNW